MSFEVVSTNAGLHNFTGLTLGNGVVVKFPDWAEQATVEYIPTAAGTGSVQYTLLGDAPSDATGFQKTSFGDLTASGGQVLSKCSYIAFVPASGTWDFRVLFQA